MTRHINQARSPEKRKPRISAAPVLCPRGTSRPMVRNRNGFRGLPLKVAAIFLASALPSRMACCAVEDMFDPRGQGRELPRNLLAPTRSRNP